MQQKQTQTPTRSNHSRRPNAQTPGRPNARMPQTAETLKTLKSQTTNTQKQRKHANILLKRSTPKQHQNPQHQHAIKILSNRVQNAIKTLKMLGMLEPLSFRNAPKRKNAQKAQTSLNARDTPKRPPRRLEDGRGPKMPRDGPELSQEAFNSSSKTPPKGTPICAPGR